MSIEKSETDFRHKSQSAARSEGSSQSGMPANTETTGNKNTTVVTEEVSMDGSSTKSRNQAEEPTNQDKVKKIFDAVKGNQKTEVEKLLESVSKKTLSSKLLCPGKGTKELDLKASRLQGTRRSMGLDGAEWMNEMFMPWNPTYIHDPALYRCSCLHLAAVLGLSQLCRLLLDKGADPCVKDRFSNSVLILAAASGDVETVKMIVAAGGSVTDVNDEEVSAVHVACKQGSVEVVEFLLQQPEVDLNKASSFMDEIPLFCAAYFGHLQVVELLVQKGADVNKTTACNLTPVHMAARNSHTNVIDFLAKNGANLNVLAWVVRGKQKKTKLRFVFRKTDICKSSPLYFAVDSTQDGSSVKVLLDHSADVEAVTCRKPYTPMMLAAAKCKVDIARMLLKAGAKVDRPDLEGKGAVSPLLYAIQSYHPGGWKAMEAKILELVKLLVEEGGASLEAMDVEINQNCVLLSVMCEMHEVFEYLLEKGADPWVFDSEDQSTVKHCLDGHCGCPRHWVLKCLQAGLFNWNNMTSFLWGVKPLDYAVFHSDIHGIKMFEAAGFLSQLCLSDAGMSGDFREGMEYFEAAVKKVPSLQNICRFVVSDAVGERPGRRAGIAALPVAEKLKCFLMYEDLLPLLKPSPPLYVESFGKMMPIVRSKHFHSMTDRELIQERGSQSEIEQLGPEPDCECECEGMGWQEFPHDPETLEDEMVSGPPDECNMC